MPDLELCPHNRPGYVDLKHIIRENIQPCDDCYAEDWERNKRFTLGVLALILTVVYVPLILMLCGFFW